jgi:hypothetical protein
VRNGMCCERAGEKRFIGVDPMGEVV